MISFSDARAHVLSAVAPLPAATVARSEARGLVLAEDVVADEPVPPFANTAMDGFAVRAADTAGAAPDAPVRLHVVGELPAGRAPEVAVGPGQAVRIMTGAPMPPGADAVVPVEATDAWDASARTSVPLATDVVTVDVPAEPGAHVRAAGGDLLPGRTVFTAGTALGPAHLGVLASLGIDEVRAHRRPRVAVLSTGDELVASGPLAPGQIRDSNRSQLLAAVAEAGCVAVDAGIARDDAGEIERRVASALDEQDALLTTGGVSVGDHDHVKSVLRRLAAARGGEYEWWQVAIKPAKPLAFGTIGGVPAFGLPGNPVSSLVSFELFARPALRRLAGHTVVDRPVIDAFAAEAMPRRPDGKLHFDRVVLRRAAGRLEATRSGEQASNVLSALADADGLALLPDGEGATPGEVLRVLLLGDLPGDPL